MLLFIAANLILKTRFWERHVIYLLPGFMLLLATACHMVLRQKGVAGKMAVWLLMVAHLLSGINLIALDYYQKDNYRDAVAIARALNPAHVFFQGDSITFAYYHLAEDKTGAESAEGQVPLHGDVDISNADAKRLKALLDRAQGKTMLILDEKSDYDAHGLYRKMAGQGIHVNSFSIVKMDAPSPPTQL
jgi:hypothetical protein